VSREGKGEEEKGGKGKGRAPPKETKFPPSDTEECSLDKSL